jgi:hypothetical protein
MTIREQKTGEGFKVDVWQPNGDLFDMSKWQIQKKLAMAERSGNTDPDLPSNHQIEGQKKVYFSDESERIANMRFASNQGFREAHGIQNKTIKDLPTRIVEKDIDRGYYFNNSNASYNKGRIRDTEIPFELRIATRGLDPATLAKNAPMSVQDQADQADLQMAQYIYQNLLQNELSSDQSFSSSDLEQIIRERFANVNDHVVQLVLDMVLHDSSLKSKVAGSFPNFKLMFCARKPSLAKQQTQTGDNINNNISPAPPAVKAVPSQQQQQQQPNQQTTALPSIPKAAASSTTNDDDEVRLQQKSASVSSKESNSSKQADWLKLRSRIIGTPIP